MSGTRRLGRRAFLGGAAGLSWTAARASASGEVPARVPDAAARVGRAMAIREEAARAQAGRAIEAPRTSGDEDRYEGWIASSTKGLPHTYLGEVVPSAYRALRAALASGRQADFERVPLGRSRKLANPLGAFAYVLEGPDPHQLAIEPPPAFASAEMAAETAELYWQALTRDVPFERYGTDALIGAACEDLSRCAAFTGPREDGRVTPRTLFRDAAPGALVGPYVSQFLYLDVPQGPMTVAQRIRGAMPGLDYLYTFERWRAVQNGDVSGRPVYEGPPRYIRSARDLATYVHRDFSFQAFLNACLILSETVGAPSYEDRGHPYRWSRTQAGFTTFGGPHVVDLVARVANGALKAAWYQKWLVHRLLRPEEMGARVHLTRTNRRPYPVHADLLGRAALDRTVVRTGTFLLTQAYGEGAPLHPSYPSGHAAVAGACATVLKAFFNEALPIAEPVEPAGDGTALRPYRGEALTVGGEIEKLAANLAFGRNAAGIHFRSDATVGFRLGEAVALGIMADMKACFAEDGVELTLTTFDGATVRV